MPIINVKPCVSDSVQIQLYLQFLESCRQNPKNKMAYALYFNRSTISSTGYNTDDLAVANVVSLMVSTVARVRDKHDRKQPKHFGANKPRRTATPENVPKDIVINLTEDSPEKEISPNGRVTDGNGRIQQKNSQKSRKISVPASVSVPEYLRIPESIHIPDSVPVVPVPVSLVPSRASYSATQILNLNGNARPEVVEKFFEKKNETLRKLGLPKHKTFHSSQSSSTKKCTCVPSWKGGNAQSCTLCTPCVPLVPSDTPINTDAAEIHEYPEKQTTRDGILPFDRDAVLSDLANKINSTSTSTSSNTSMEISIVQQVENSAHKIAQMAQAELMESHSDPDSQMEYSTNSSPPVIASHPHISSALYNDANDDVPMETDKAVFSAGNFSKDLSTMIQTLKSKTSGPQYMCAFCNNPFKAEDRLRRHILRNHTYRQTFTCGICKREFMGKSALREHQMAQHSLAIMDAEGKPVHLSFYHPVRTRNDKKDNVIDVDTQDVSVSAQDKNATTTSPSKTTQLGTSVTDTITTSRTSNSPFVTPSSMNPPPNIYSPSYFDLNRTDVAEQKPVQQAPDLRDIIAKKQLQSLQSSVINYTSETSPSIVQNSQIFMQNSQTSCVSPSLQTQQSLPIPMLQSNENSTPTQDVQTSQNSLPIPISHDSRIPLMPQNYLGLPMTINSSENSQTQIPSSNSQMPSSNPQIPLSSLNSHLPISTIPTSQTSQYSSSQVTQSSDVATISQSDTNSPLPPANPPNVPDVTETPFETEDEEYLRMVLLPLTPDERTRYCVICKKLFGKRCDLRRHLMVHTGERPYKCSECGQGFKSRGASHYHMKVKHNLDVPLSAGMEKRVRSLRSHKKYDDSTEKLMPDISFLSQNVETSDNNTSDSRNEFYETDKMIFSQMINTQSQSVSEQSQNVTEPICRIESVSSISDIVPQKTASNMTKMIKANNLEKKINSILYRENVAKVKAIIERESQHCNTRVVNHNGTQICRVKNEFGADVRQSDMFTNFYQENSNYDDSSQSSCSQNYDDFNLTRNIDDSGLLNAHNIIHKAKVVVSRCDNIIANSPALSSPTNDDNSNDASDAEDSVRVTRSRANAIKASKTSTDSPSTNNEKSSISTAPTNSGITLNQDISFVQNVSQSNQIVGNITVHQNIPIAENVLVAVNNPITDNSTINIKGNSTLNGNHDTIENQINKFVPHQLQVENISSNETRSVINVDSPNPEIVRDPSDPTMRAMVFNEFMDCAAPNLEEIAEIERRKLKKKKKKLKKEKKRQKLLQQSLAAFQITKIHNPGEGFPPITPATPQLYPGMIYPNLANAITTNNQLSSQIDPTIHPHNVTSPHFANLLNVNNQPVFPNMHLQSGPQNGEQSGQQMAQPSEQQIRQQIISQSNQIVGNITAHQNIPSGQQSGQQIAMQNVQMPYQTIQPKPFMDLTMLPKYIVPPTPENVMSNVKTPSAIYERYPNIAPKPKNVEMASNVSTEISPASAPNAYECQRVNPKLGRWQNYCHENTNINNNANKNSNNNNANKNSNNNNANKNSNNINSKQSNNEKIKSIIERETELIQYHGKVLRIVSDVSLAATQTAIDQFTGEVLKIYKCGICDKITDSMNDICRHLCTHCTNAVLYPCPKCSESFAHMLDLINHYSNHLMFDGKCHSFKEEPIKTENETDGVSLPTSVTSYPNVSKYVEPDEPQSVKSPKLTETESTEPASKADIDKTISDTIAKIKEKMAARKKLSNRNHILAKKIKKLMKANPMHPYKTVSQLNLNICSESSPKKAEIVNPTLKTMTFDGENYRTPSGRYVCNVCGCSFVQNFALRNHIKNHNNKDHVYRKSRPVTLPTTPTGSKVADSTPVKFMNTEMGKLNNKPVRRIQFPYKHRNRRRRGTTLRFLPYVAPSFNAATQARRSVMLTKLRQICSQDSDHQDTGNLQSGELNSPNGSPSGLLSPNIDSLRTFLDASSVGIQNFLDASSGSMINVTQQAYNSLASDNSDNAVINDVIEINSSSEDNAENDSLDNADINSNDGSQTINTEEQLNIANSPLKHLPVFTKKRKRKHKRKSSSPQRTPPSLQKSKSQTPNGSESPLDENMPVLHNEVEEKSQETLQCITDDSNKISNTPGAVLSSSANSSPVKLVQTNMVFDSNGKQLIQFNANGQQITLNGQTFYPLISNGQPVLSVGPKSSTAKQYFQVCPQGSTQGQPLIHGPFTMFSPSKTSDDTTSDDMNPIVNPSSSLDTTQTTPTKPVMEIRPMPKLQGPMTYTSETTPNSHISTPTQPTPSPSQTPTISDPTPSCESMSQSQDSIEMPRLEISPPNDVTTSLNISLTPLKSPILSPHKSMTSPNVSLTSPHKSMTSPNLSLISPHESMTSPNLLSSPSSMTSPNLLSSPSPHKSMTSPNLSLSSPHKSMTSPNLLSSSSSMTSQILFSPPMMSQNMPSPTLMSARMLLSSSLTTSRSRDRSPVPNIEDQQRRVSSLSTTKSRLAVYKSIDRNVTCRPVITANGISLYQCCVCPKTFSTYADINRHVNFHEDIRPFKCQSCDYYARTSSQLKTHMMRHQGIRCFECKPCIYRGVTQSDLNRHIKSQMHYMKMNNLCGKCGVGFISAVRLQCHETQYCPGKGDGITDQKELGFQKLEIYS